MTKFTAQEKLYIVSQAHNHINTAYDLLLSVIPRHQEDHLTRVIARVEDFLEGQTSYFIEERTAEGTEQ